MESEPDLGNHPEDRQHREPPQVDRHEWRLPRFEPAKQYREPHPEEQREDPPRLLLDPHPDDPADQVFEARGLEPHLLVEMDQDHAEQGESAEDVECIDPLVLAERGDCRRDGHASAPAGVLGEGDGCASLRGMCPPELERTRSNPGRPPSEREACGPAAGAIY